MATPIQAGTDSIRREVLPIQAGTDSIRREVFSDIIQSYITPTKGRELKIVVVGEAGQGKSTLINGLLGKEVANEGDQFDAGTAEIKYYNLNQNGISVKIWDTPGFGFGSEEEDQKMVEQLRSSDCFPHDLALFCFRMDGTRFPTRVHTDTVKMFTEVFGRKFWEHTMFILTFANSISQLCPVNEELEFFFSNRVSSLEDKIHAMLKKTVDGLSDDEVKKIRAIPVGSYKKGGYDPNNPWRLPDREDWFLWFWIECTEHIRQASLCALLQANRHRIKIPVVNEVAPAFGEDPPLNKEAYERSIQPPPKGPSLEEIDDGVQDGGGLEETCKDTKESLTAPLQPSSDSVIQIEDTTEVITEVSENITSPHARMIPVYEMLRHQLDNEDSSFYHYVKEYALKRGESFRVAGHIGGMIEGFCEWLGKRTRKIKQKKH